MQQRLTVFARNMRKDMTLAEKLIWKSVRAHRLSGLHFKRQVPCGGYIADFLSQSQRLVIEIDGATHSADKEIAYDAKRDAWFKEQGYLIMRFTNDDIFSNLDGVLDTILDRINLGKSAPASLSLPPP